MLDGWRLCQMFSYYEFSGFMELLESGLGGRKGRYKQTTRNPQADGRRG